MKSGYKIYGLSALLVVGLIVFVIGTTSGNQPSPRKSSEMTLNGKKISLDYGAPSMRGRKIFGTLVPYDQVWRLGANRATHLTTEANLILGGVDVPAGTYTLYAFPTEGAMKLIINKKTGQWGIPYPKETEDMELARVDFNIDKVETAVEQMSLKLTQAGNGGAIVFEWENTRATVAFSEKM